MLNIYFCKNSTFENEIFSPLAGIFKIPLSYFYERKTIIVLMIEIPPRDK